MKVKPAVKIVPMPKIRKIVVDTVEIGKKRHHMKGLLEIDVTAARSAISKIKIQTNKPFSFTGWIAHCVGAAVQKYPESHGILKRNSIYIFQDVDISIMVEKQIENKPFPAVFVIKKANQKTPYEINEVIQEAKITNEKVYFDKTNNKGFKFLVSLPKFFRYLFFWSQVRRNPFFQKKYTGTVNITSVGMFGNIAGWPLIDSTCPMVIAVGSIMKKPWNVKGEILLRDILHMTILLDHDVIDGAPAARFIQYLVNLLEIADGL